MRTMEFFGRNVDEAIFHGLVEMGLTIDQVKTEIVQKESKGLFGLGAKNAVVRITELEAPVTPVFDVEKNPENRSSKGSSRNTERRKASGKSDSSKPVHTSPNFAYSEEPLSA